MPALKVYSSVLLGAKFIEEISGNVLGWSRSIKKDGGYWLGNFSMVGDIRSLSRWFYTRLGSHFVETNGSRVTWEGMIYEIDLTIASRNGLATTRRRSLDAMFNSVYSTYIDEQDPPETHETSVAENAESITQYGKRQDMLTLDGFAQAASEARRDAWLKENAWPWARTVGTGVAEQAKLDVTVAGYSFTANWRYLTALLTPGGDGMVDLSDWVAAVVGTDMEFLSTGIITTNSVRVKPSVNVPQRAWDVVSDMMALGDSSGNPWHAWVGENRKLHIAPVSNEPLYYLRGGKLYKSVGGTSEISQWEVQPGVVRDLDWPVSGAEYSAFLQQARDFYATEVEASMDNGLTLKTDEFDDFAVANAQREYKARLENEAETAAGGSSLMSKSLSSSGGAHTQAHWKMNKMTKEQWGALSIEERKAINLKRRNALIAKRKKKNGG